MSALPRFALQKLSDMVNWFNFRKCTFLPLLHGFMEQAYGGKTYALLTYVATRWSSRGIMAKSAVRSNLRS